jgi:glycosyltransferase involved in cell wall biosynthesis
MTTREQIMPSAWQRPQFQASVSVEAEKYIGVPSNTVASDPYHPRGQVRIAHLSSVHQVHDVRIYQKECRSLHQAGYEVQFVGIGKSSGDPEGPKIIGLQRSRSRTLRIAFTWTRVLRAALHTRARLFHLHDPELIFVGAILKALGKKVIFDCHEYYVRDMVERAYIWRPLRRTLASAVNIALRVADRYFDGIVVAAPGMLRDFANPHSTLINNYPEWEIDGSITKKFSERPPRIAYVGSISEPRGIREIVKAMEIVGRSTNVSLLLCGKFTPAGLLDEMRAQPGWQWVDYRGLVSRNEVQQLLDQAIAGLVIFRDSGNHRESSPNKLFEYMAVGLPTIITNFPSWHALLDPVGASLTVDPRDPQAIANSILHVIGNRGEAEAMGKRGQQAVLEQFSWTGESKKLVALYDALLLDRPTGH